jgi:sterol desaturase/sphingolipid hydroxylase (fatty acid hydroxylase superfamily)
MFVELLHWAVSISHNLKRIVDPLGPFAFFYTSGSWVLWPIASFVMIGLIMYAASSRHSAPFSIRGAFRFVFPRDFYKHPTTRIDFWNYVLANVFLMRPVGLLLALIWTGQQLRELLINEFGPPTFIIGSGRVTGVCEALLIILIAELGFYAAHYACHKMPALWRIHAAHHSAEVLTPFTGIRAHPLEFVILNLPKLIGASIATGIVLYFTGPQLAHGAAPLLFFKMMYDQLIVLLEHSHLRISYGRLNYLLCSPIMHQIHHSAELRHRDKNIGGFCSLYDWLFGTLYLPTGPEEFQLGKNLEETGDRNPHRTLKQFYLEPIVGAYRTYADRRSSVRRYPSTSELRRGLATAGPALSRAVHRPTHG